MDSSWENAVAGKHACMRHTLAGHSLTVEVAPEARCILANLMDLPDLRQDLAFTHD
jgi:hypothetical protein